MDAVRVVVHLHSVRGTVEGLKAEANATRSEVPMSIVPLELQVDVETRTYVPLSFPSAFQ